MKRREEYIVDCSNENPDMPKMKDCPEKVSFYKKYTQFPPPNMSEKQFTSGIKFAAILFILLFVIFVDLGVNAYLHQQKTLGMIFYGIAAFFFLCLFSFAVTAMDYLRNH